MAKIETDSRKSFTEKKQQQQTNNNNNKKHTMNK